MSNEWLIVEWWVGRHTVFPLRAQVPLKQLHEFGIAAKCFLVVFYVPIWAKWRIALPIYGGVGREGSMVHVLEVTRGT